MERHELIALSKALYFIKFSNNEIEKGFLAGSPIINKLLEDANIALFEEFKKTRPDYSGKWGLIEDNKLGALSEVIEHVKNIQDRNWVQLSNEIKISQLKNLCFPFDVKDETIEKIIADRDALLPQEPIGAK